MDPVIVEALLALNRSFYDTFAGDFARTRRSSPPGFDRILPYLRQAANVVDLGCGSGRLLSYLAAHGWRGRYRGIDGSAGLLQAAQQAVAGYNLQDLTWIQADLMAGAWQEHVPPLGPADGLAALAVLHHIPGAANRLAFVRSVAALMPSGSYLVLSTWQFMSSERLRRRLLPWSAAGLREEEVEAGDYLMSWGQGAAGQRYVAAIGPEDLTAMTAYAGLAAVESFTTDGHEGDLNLYGVFRRAPAGP